MATLEELVAAGNLLEYEADLEDAEFPERAVYFTPDFDAWVAGTLAGLVRRKGRNMSPYEQAEQRLYEFVIGKRLAYGSEFHPLDPLTASVWELKVADVRLFGWFPKRRHFIIVRAELKEKLRKHSDYAPHIARVVAFRDALDLDEPKAVTGVRQDEVI